MKSFVCSRVVLLQGVENKYMGIVCRQVRKMGKFFLSPFLMTLSDMTLSLMRQIIPIRRRRSLSIDVLGLMWLHALTLTITQRDGVTAPSDVS